MKYIGFQPETTGEERVQDLLAVCPPGFELPTKLLEIVGDELEDLEPWFFLGYVKQGAQRWKTILAEQFPERVLVPFAKHDSSDDVFCFDGTDLSVDPPVVIIHSFTTPGWEFRGQWKNFAAWWEEAQEQHEAWLREENGE